MKKMTNKKGYLTIEIILGATIAFAIAFLLVEITVKMVSDTEDNYRDTTIITDNPLIVSGIKEEIEGNESGIKSIEHLDNGYTIKYKDDSIGTLTIVNDNGKNKILYTELGTKKYERELDNSLSNISVTSSVKDDVGDSSNIYIKIIGENIFTGKDYDIIIPLENKVKVTPPETPDVPENPDVPEKPDVPEGPKTLAEYITNLYIDADRTQVTNNKVRYSYAPSENLMNDAFAGTVANIDYGNIRYYGASPNNYIYFNCNDYSNQTSDTCEKWKIIGVFEVETPNGNGNYTKERKVKIIRENKLGGYAWDTSAQSVNSGYGINQWGATSNYEGADLMRLLNPGYTNSSINNSLYWEAGAGTCYTSYNNVTKPCDFTSSGLKNSQTKNVISKTKWSLGNGDSVESYVNEMYKVERGTSVITSPTDRVKRTTSWDGYVALAYPSDILYTSDFRTCTTNMNNVFRYEDKCGSSTAWLANLYDSQKDSISMYSTYAYWLLTPGVRSVEFVYRFDGSHFSNSKAASGWLLENEGVDGEVIPTLYLDAGALYKQGNGSSDTPYQILIN